MIWLYATCASAILFGIGGFLLKVGSHKNYSEASMLLGLYFVGSVVLYGMLLRNGGIYFNRDLLGLSILVGLGSYFGNAFLVKAYDTGPACLTAPLMSMSVVFIILLSAWTYNETISHIQYMGVAIMVIAAVLLGINFKNTAIKNKMWSVFVVLGIIFLFLREGGLKIAFESGLDNVMVLFWGYIFASALAIIAFLMDTKTFSILSKKNKGIFLGAIIGVFSGAGMGLLAYAITLGPTAIIVPLFSARNIITVLLILIFFKEKLSSLQWGSIWLMLTGLLLIS